MAAMVKVYPGPDPHVMQGEDGRYYLRSPALLQFTDCLEVRNAAARLLRTMCGLLNLYGNYVGEVWAENAEWLDSEGQRGGLGASVRSRGNVVNPEVVRRLQERSVPGGPTVAAQLQLLCSRNPSLKAILEVAGWDSLSWGKLYLLYELLSEAVGGPQRLAALGGVSGKDMNRFRRTANSYRHASAQPPESFNRMSILEAIPFVRSLVKAWMDDQL